MLRRKSLPHRNRNRTPVSAITVMDNEDLLRMILLRLPVRSLLKFKCVSKRWCSLISSRTFAHHHDSTSHPRRPSGIFLGRRYPNPLVFEFLDLSTDSSASFESFDFFGHEDDYENEIEVLHSCNGLFLISFNENDSEDRDYYVYNPTTKQFAELPELPDEDEEGGVGTPVTGMYLAFDPSRSPNYEVVCSRRLVYNKEIYQINVYSSETGDWRLSTAVLESPATKFGGYWKNGVYWISPWNQCFYFNLGEDKIQIIPMPRVTNGLEWHKRRIEYFGDCCGCLYLVELSNFELDVWEMQDRQSGWSMKHHVDFRRLCVAYPDLRPDEHYFGRGFPHFSVITIVDKGGDHQLGDEEPYVVLHINRNLQEELVRVNVKSGSFELLIEVEEAEEIDAYLFMESLAFV